MANLIGAAAASAGAPSPPRRPVTTRIVPIGFAALISLGTFLLLLPPALREGQSIHFIDALFLATSATCVTGLSTLNIAETFSTFGQAVILCLIQAGGLGIYTAGISIVLLSGNRLSLADEQTIHATVGRLQQARPRDIFIYACLFVLLFELAGTVALFIALNHSAPAADVTHTLWTAAFHAISAFCNAGISTAGENLVRWRNDPAVLAIMCALAIGGGLGLMTLINLRYYYWWRRDPRRRGRISMQTRLALLTSGLLLIFGTAATLGFETDHTLAEARGWQIVGWAFLHSAMTRTAGFNVVDVGEMNPPTLLLTLGLMFVGGSPGSMAGGIKTVTLAVLVLTAWSALRRQEEVQFWGRRIPARTSAVAVMLIVISGLTLAAAVAALMVVEEGRPSVRTAHRSLALVFEAVSAFGTVGLSTGITPLLSMAGKLTIIVLMFTGRVGPLILAVYLARPASAQPVRYPREELNLG